MQRANAAAEEERQEQEHAAKMERDKAKAQHNIYNAIRRKDVGAIEAMIAKGVDLDKPNDEGKSPRAYAEELGDEKVWGVLGEPTEMEIAEATRNTLLHLNEELDKTKICASRLGDCKHTGIFIRDSCLLLHVQHAVVKQLNPHDFDPERHQALRRKNN